MSSGDSHPIIMKVKCQSCTVDTEGEVCRNSNTHCERCSYCVLSSGDFSAAWNDVQQCRAGATQNLWIALTLAYIDNVVYTISSWYQVLTIGMIKPKVCWIVAGCSFSTL